MNSEQKNKAIEEALQSAIMAIKSVDFLEAESNKILSRINELEKKLETSLSYDERERLTNEIFELEPKLTQLIHRCSIEKKIIDSCKTRYNMK